ncbi:MAG: hypothetical protein PHP82_02595 [Candidatus ainarchaeum sp.]|nr:hypothetical protein [Candidatus ainarchaeum sp.]
MVDLKEWLKIKRGKSALNESRPKKEKNLNARRQANEAKKILFLHKKRVPSHHKKVVVKKE